MYILFQISFARDEPLAIGNLYLFNRPKKQGKSVKKCWLEYCCHYFCHRNKKNNAAGILLMIRQDKQLPRVLLATEKHGRVVTSTKLRQKRDQRFRETGLTFLTKQPLCSSIVSTRGWRVGKDRFTRVMGAFWIITHEGRKVQPHSLPLLREHCLKIKAIKHFK